MKITTQSFQPTTDCKVTETAECVTMEDKAEHDSNWLWIVISKIWKKTRKMKP